MFSIQSASRCTLLLAMLAAGGAAAQDVANAARVKNPGDMSYRAMWSIQKRVAAMQPQRAHLISPVLRLSIEGMGEAERAEFMPAPWGVAIVGKTVEAIVPMRRGGYFAVPALPQAQARSEDAIVMFNAQARKNQLDVGWQLNLPASGVLAYRQFGQALDEMSQVQSDIPWWDMMAWTDKRARFDALRACFSNENGVILVAGQPAGQQLSAHCIVLPFDRGQLRADPAIAFIGTLDYVTLDSSID